MNWTTLFLIIFTLVSIDKILTYMNIEAVKKNHPQEDALSIEKNPLARFFYGKFGMLFGSVVYLIISIITTLLGAYVFVRFAPWGISNINYFVYGLFIIYGLVITNNLYFLLKFTKII